MLAVIAVCLLEFGVLRTGLFRRAAYWISMVIVFGFQILVDGWLTKLSAPIVVYDERHTSGLRFPFDIPVEDFLFGWAMVTAVLLLWERQRLTRSAGADAVRSRLVTASRDIPAAFDAGAAAYDKLVGANPGYHGHLRISAQRMRLQDQGRGLRLLDAGCGTGASTAALLAVAPKAEIVAVDGSAGMLAQAARQAMAIVGAIRAQPHRRPRRRRGSRPFRRHPGRLPAAQPARSGRTTAAPFAGCCGRARHLPSTSTRCATRGSPPRCGTPSAPPSSFRVAGCAAAMRRSTSTCDAA